MRPRGFACFAAPSRCKEAILLLLCGKHGVVDTREAQERRGTQAPMVGWPRDVQPPRAGAPQWFQQAGIP